jgi:hypothetical protein
MSSNFPSSLDSLTNPISSNTLDSPDHAAQHANANDAIELIEAKVGADSSAVTTSHDYKLSGVTSSAKAVSNAVAIITSGKTLSVSNTLTLSGTDSTTMTFPSTNASVARTDAANTFTGASTASAWVLTSPTITTSIVPTSDDGAALGSTGNKFSDVFLAEGGVINWDSGDATLTQAGDVVTLAGANLVATFNAVTLAAIATMGENSELQLDTVLSADGKYCGITEVVTAGETVAFGEMVYLKTADSQWYLTDADADSTAGAVRVAIAVTSGTDNNTMTVMTYGKIRADAKFPTFTIGLPVYLSTTAGALQTTQPSGTDDVIRIAGYGNTGDELFFCPSNDYLTHT